MATILTEEQARNLIIPMLPHGVKIDRCEIFTSDLPRSTGQRTSWYNETGLSCAGVLFIITDGRRKDGFFVGAKNGNIYHTGVRDRNRSGDSVDARRSRVRANKLSWEKV